MEPFEGQAEDGGIIGKQELIENTANGALNDNIDVPIDNIDPLPLDPNQLEDESAIPGDFQNGESSGETGTPAIDGIGMTSISSVKFVV